MQESINLKSPQLTESQRAEQQDCQPGTPSSSYPSSCSLVAPELSPDEIKNVEEDKKAENWTKQETQLFFSYWFNRIISFPYQTYTCGNPLKSLFLLQKSAGRVQKDKKQCKSKFWTIKRRLNTERKKNKKAPKFNFIDAMVKEAQTLKPLPPYLKDQILQIKTLREESSSLMKVTQELARRELKEESQDTNQDLLKYLKENQVELSF